LMVLSPLSKKRWVRIYGLQDKNTFWSCKTL
jgi:hypothetical protein